jgi:hypothetical protein
MLKKFIYCTLSFLPIWTFGQSYVIYHNDTVNKINSNGLKYGRQIKFGYNNQILVEGTYKIVINKKINWEKEKNNIYNVAEHKEVVDKTGKPISFSARYGDSLSVADGYWVYYALNDFESLYISYYKNGELIIGKEIQNNKIKIESISKQEKNNYHTYEYFDGDNSISKIKYREDRREKIVCFPDRELEFNKCETGIGVLYSKTYTDTIIINAKDNDVSIHKIECLEKDVSITNTKGDTISRLKISANKKDTILLVYSPKTRPYDIKNKFSYFTEIKLYTNKYTYRINAQIFNSHIDLSNYNVKEFRLQKEKSKSTFLEVYLGDFHYRLFNKQMNFKNFNELANFKDYNTLIFFGNWQKPYIDFTNLGTGAYYFIIDDGEKIINNIKIILYD